MQNKRSFFERLTGAVRLDENMAVPEEPPRHLEVSNELEDEEVEGQLTVDVYQTPSEIIIKTMVAGVRPDDIDVSISRDKVVIRGKREEERNIVDEDYYFREL